MRSASASARSSAWPTVSVPMGIGTGACGAGVGAATVGVAGAAFGVGSRSWARLLIVVVSGRPGERADLAIGGGERRRGRFEFRGRRPAHSLDCHAALR